MTDQQRYSVEDRLGPIEIRRYAACVVADVVVSGSEESAGNRAFRPLVGYIGGRNRRSEALAMTAPVLQAPAGESLAMTAPVLQEAGTGGTWVVSFVLPGNRLIDDYPEPLDPGVVLRSVPSEEAAALRWSGRWTAGNVERRRRELLAGLEGSPWHPAGPDRWARFDPPWRPAFLRRNEIVVPVRRAAVPPA